MIYLNKSFIDLTDVKPMLLELLKKELETKQFFNASNINFNLSIKDTIKTWSIMETIVSIIGLLGVLVLDQVI
jgi:hypothetical protein